MGFRAVAVTEILEVLALWRAGRSLRSIARATGLDRKTVRRYVEAARLARLQPTGPADEEDARAVARAVGGPGRRRVSPQRHALASARSFVAAWLGVGAPLARVHAALAEHGVAVSYATLRRFAIDELGWGRAREAA